MYIVYPEYFMFPNFEMLDIDEDLYRQDLEEKIAYNENPYEIIDENYANEAIGK